MASLAKKYAIAFIEGLENEALQILLSKKEVLNQCLNDENFRNTLLAPFVNLQQKVELLVQCLDINHQSIKQAFFVVAKSERLMLLGNILHEIETLLNSDKKECHATLFSHETLDSSLVQIFKEQLEKKMGYQVWIKEALWSKEEIKCCIEELDLEISFSKEKFDRDLKNFILVSFLQGVQIEN